MPTIGVLALQGGFAEHISTLKRIPGASSYTILPVRTQGELEQCDALIIPGGESTTISLLASRFNLTTPLQEFVRSKPTLGTCAGLIMLSGKIEGGIKGQTKGDFGGLESVTVQRNAYGRQIDSFAKPVEFAAGLISGDKPLGVFIRAPSILEVGEGVEVIGQFEGKPVAVKKGNVVGMSFHPELTGDTRIHEWWLRDVVEKFYEDCEKKVKA